MLRKYPNIWATFVIKFYIKNYKNRTIWSHCSPVKKEFFPFWTTETFPSGNVRCRRIQSDQEKFPGGILSEHQQGQTKPYLVVLKAHQAGCVFCIQQRQKVAVQKMRKIPISAKCNCLQQLHMENTARLNEPLVSFLSKTLSCLSTPPLRVGSSRICFLKYIWIETKSYCKCFLFALIKQFDTDHLLIGMLCTMSTVLIELQSGLKPRVVNLIKAQRS